MLLVPVFFVTTGLGPALDRPPPGWPISLFVCSKRIQVISEESCTPSCKPPPVCGASFSSPDAA
ncbi:hypothetical protein PR003_g14350 [Phytophthora rubi]|uniref:Secreted protein n=1 Tax=Phytophthora rubi TaxID=129364 RepID=A0A6A3L7V7_9STRA|nr:hypothetical protein PR002_g14041 [Phytophthora rubi]KAE9332768.1 hypothetical protein PR003_g14350 [Phytophthora rubi]